MIFTISITGVNGGENCGKRSVFCEVSDAICSVGKWRLESPKLNMVIFCEVRTLNVGGRLWLKNFCIKNGTPDRIRTYDTQLRKLVLYPLSYGRTVSLLYQIFPVSGIYFLFFDWRLCYNNFI